MGTASRHLTRRAFVLAATGVGAASLLAACGQASTPTQAPGASDKSTSEKPAPAAQAPSKSAGPREVSFMSSGNEGDQQMFKEAIDAAQQATLSAEEITINWQPYPGGGWDKIMTMFAAGQAYDIQRIDDDRVYLLAVENKVHQLDGWMFDHKMNKDDYFPVFWKTLSIEGHQFSMNPAGGADVIYYNVDLFDQAGITAPTSWKEAWSWDQFLANAEKVAKVSGGRTEVYALGFPPNIATPTGHGAGATALNADQTTCSFAGPDVHAAIDPFVQMTVKDQIIAPPELNRLELFNAGKLAMTWESMGFDRQVSKSIKWDIMPWMKTPKFAMTENYDRTFVIAKSAKDPEAAFLGLKTLCEKAASDVFAKYRFGIPYLKASAEGPILNDPETPPTNKNVWFETFGDVDGHPVDVPLPRGPIGEAWKQAFTGELFESARSGQISTQDYLNQACQRVDQEIAKWGWNKDKGLELLKQGGGLSHPNRKFAG